MILILWKKNLFKVASGKSEKNFILELALKVLMVLLALLLQKPSKTSKAKDHRNKLEIRFQLWKDGIYLVDYAKVVRFKKDYEISSKKIKETKPNFFQT